MKTISVVLPNFNGRKLLEKNLPWLFKALENSNLDYEIIIADDASSDDSLSFIEEYYPQIKIVTSKINKGFSKNINCGLTKASNDLVLALNTDVKLEEDYFTILVPYFMDSNIFAVSGSIRNFENDEFQDAAKYPVWKGTVLKSNLNYRGKHENKLPSLFLSGANTLFDREKLIQLKGFDEAFSPFYGEDVELGIRALRLGWKSYCIVNAICRHEVSSTIPLYNKRKYIKKISARNKLGIQYIHTGKFHRFLWISEVTLQLFIRWLLFDFKYYSSFVAFLRNKKAYHHSREEFKRNKPMLSFYKALWLLKKDISSIEIQRF